MNGRAPHPRRRLGRPAAGLLSLLALLPPAGAAAQRPDMVLGFKAGLSAATLSTEDRQFLDMTARKGVVAGFFLELGPGPLAIRPEALYAEKGGIFDGQREEYQDYLEVAVLLVARVPYTLGGVQPFVAAGPAVSRCRDACGGRTLDLGAGLGGGGTRSHGRWTGVLEARYTRGFVDYLYDFQRERLNRTWSLTVGLGAGIL